MDNNRNSVQVMPLETAQAAAPVYEYADVVAIPRSEYNDLARARLGIDLIGCTLGKYGPEDKVVLAVCKQFGYEYKEELHAE